MITCQGTAMEAPTETTGSGASERIAASVAGPEVIERLDRVLLALRRLVAKPPAAMLPIPSLGHCVDFAKVMACLAIADSDRADGADLAVKDVATALHLEHSTVSRLLGEAEEEGLVERRADPQDRRRTAVSLTATGRSVVSDSNVLRMAVVSRVFAEWSPADLGLLVDLLERMVATVDSRMPEVVAELSGRPGGGSPC